MSFGVMVITEFLSHQSTLVNGLSLIGGNYRKLLLSNYCSAVSRGIPNGVNFLSLVLGCLRGLSCMEVLVFYCGGDA